MTDEDFRQWLAAADQRSRQRIAAILRDLATEVEESRATLVGVELRTTPLDNGLFPVTFRFQVANHKTNGK